MYTEIAAKLFADDNELRRLRQQICDLEFSVDTIKLAYQQSEQRCAELAEAVNVRANAIIDLEQQLDDAGQDLYAAHECLRVIADWIDVHSHLHKCFHTPELEKWRTATDLALSQTSPKE